MVKTKFLTEKEKDYIIFVMPFIGIIMFFVGIYDIIIRLLGFKK